MRGTDSRAIEAARPTIAHLLPWVSIGGVEVATLRIIEATRDQFRHVAFCMQDAIELKLACEEAGALVVSYVPPEPSLRHAIRYFNESLVVAREMRRLGVNLAVCSETKATYHNRLAVFLARVPMITHVRSRYPEMGLRDRLGFLGVSGYIFVSQDSRRQFAIKVPDAKARVLYDAVDVTEPPDSTASTTLRQQLGVPAEVTLVGMIARVNPQKDYYTLASAAAQVLAKRSDVRFMVVGDNSKVELNRTHYAHVDRRLRDLGIADRFIFTGFRSDVAAIVSALDIFVLCTHREGLPLSILEAMALGKPVIATSVDGIPEVITNGVTGFLHAHQNSEELAEAILTCIEHPEVAKKVGDAAREHCRSAYNSSVFAASVTKIYDEFLQQ